MNPLLITSYGASGFTYFTRIKLLWIRSQLPKPLAIQDVRLAREITAELNRKQTGGTVQGRKVKA